MTRKSQAAGQSHRLDPLWPRLIIPKGWLSERQMGGHWHGRGNRCPQPVFFSDSREQQILSSLET